MLAYLANILDGFCYKIKPVAAVKNQNIKDYFLIIFVMSPKAIKNYIPLVKLLIYTAVQPSVTAPVTLQPLLVTVVLVAGGGVALRFMAATITAGTINTAILIFRTVI